MPITVEFKDLDTETFSFEDPEKKCHGYHYPNRYERKELFVVFNNCFAPLGSKSSQTYVGEQTISTDVKE